MTGGDLNGSLTLGLLQVAWEAGGLASSCQDGAERRGQAAHSDPAERDEGGRQAAVRHTAAEAQLLGGQQRLQDADETKRRAAFGNEVHLVPVRTQVRRDLLQRPGPEQTHTTLSFCSKSNQKNHIIAMQLIWLMSTVYLLFVSSDISSAHRHCN